MPVSRRSHVRARLRLREKQRRRTASRVAAALCADQPVVVEKHPQLRQLANGRYVWYEG